MVRSSEQTYAVRLRDDKAQPTTSFLAFSRFLSNLSLSPLSLALSSQSPDPRTLPWRCGTDPSPTTPPNGRHGIRPLGSDGCSRGRNTLSGSTESALRLPIQSRPGYHFSSNIPTSIWLMFMMLLDFSFKLK